MLTGNVIGEGDDHHSAKEYIGFLKKVDKHCEKGETLRHYARGPIGDKATAL
jgi:hypothetical protein